MDPRMITPDESRVPPVQERDMTSNEIDISRQKHQQAQIWAEQLVEHLHWMEGATREIFLTSAIEIAITELSDVDISIAFNGTWNIENVLRESKGIFGEDDE
jgi:hypothetical protein